MFSRSILRRYQRFSSLYLSPSLSFSLNHSYSHSLSRCVSLSSSSNLEEIFQKQKTEKYFQFQSLEKDIYQWWEREGYFKPTEPLSSSSLHSSILTPEDDPFVISMPPPNVTGKLHVGHALFVALQDVMVRFQRMRGRSTLWLPGTDHAGIATQLLVERKLLKEGISKHDLGREEFLRRIWDFKNEHGGHITSQLRRLGASADWSREKFTLDTDLSESVTEAFLQLYEKGLIYRGAYMVNWSPSLQTALSDLEVEFSEEEGVLYSFKYILADSTRFIPVATTRPETILGDTAVCVHPDDVRYQDLIGKSVVVPFSNGRQIPGSVLSISLTLLIVISDPYVDMEFGTGALKITPGHDHNDYTLGSKHQLPSLLILNKDGTMNHNCGKYEGLDRFECRKILWNDLVSTGLAIESKKHVQRVPRSQRSGEIIEPLLSEQWFVKMDVRRLLLVFHSN
jgi:valyl-tRNA synthetase